MIKTERFGSPRYLGDPVNVINLFNRFEVDEIVLLDVRATVNGAEPPFELISQLAEECWVPLTYGGGIRDVESARRVLASGVEKVVIGTAAVEIPHLVSAASGEFGAQAVVVAIDAMARGPSRWEVMIRSGSKGTGIAPQDYARQVADLGAGELFLNSVDRDGTMEGFDMELVKSVSQSVSVPVVACGGAGERSQLAEPIVAGGASAVAAGSLFVFSERGGGWDPLESTCRHASLSIL